MKIWVWRDKYDLKNGYATLSTSEPVWHCCEWYSWSGDTVTVCASVVKEIFGQLQRSAKDLMEFSVRAALKDVWIDDGEENTDE